MRRRWIRRGRGDHGLERRRMDENGKMRDVDVADLRIEHCLYSFFNVRRRRLASVGENSFRRPIFRSHTAPPQTKRTFPKFWIDAISDPGYESRVLSMFRVHANVVSYSRASRARHEVFGEITLATNLASEGSRRCRRSRGNFCIVVSTRREFRFDFEFRPTFTRTFE